MKREVQIFHPKNSCFLCSQKKRSLTNLLLASAGKKGVKMDKPSWPQKVPATIKAKIPQLAAFFTHHACDFIYYIHISVLVRDDRSSKWLRNMRNKPGYSFAKSAPIHKRKIQTSWCSQPIWKTCTVSESNWIISPRFGVKIEICDTTTT